MARSLFLHNARVLTMDRPNPTARAVLLHDGRIEAVGEEGAIARAARAAGAEDIDLAGRVVLPAFIDAHIHLLAYAGSLVSLDCGPDSAESIADIVALVRERAQALPPGTWIKAAGYDEQALSGRRHPTRHDLDRAAPDHPVRLLHRGGHACVLNSRALAMAGIDGSTPEPPGRYMERDLDTGEPAGLLVEMNDLVDRVVTPLSPAEIRTAVAEAGRRLLAAGVTMVQDAGPHNGPADWALIAEMQSAGALRQSVSLMEGLERLGEMPEGAGRLRRGPVKVMPRELEHEFHPSASELAAMLARIVESGRQAAVHAVTRRGIDTVLEAFSALGETARGSRIEHCGVCSQDQARRIADLGLAVVTQPGFVYWNGDSMLGRLREDDLPDLYPLRRLLDAGVAVAGSSDAPVARPDVLASVRASVLRRTRSGAPLAAAQAISAIEALELFTVSAAEVLGADGERGRVRPGLVADLVVLNQDPTDPGVDWKTVEVDMTLMDGEVVFRR